MAFADRWAAWWAAWKWVLLLAVFLVMSVWLNVHQYGSRREAAADARAKAYAQALTATGEIAKQATKDSDQLLDRLEQIALRGERTRVALAALATAARTKPTPSLPSAVASALRAFAVPASFQTLTMLPAASASDAARVLASCPMPAGIVVGSKRPDASSNGILFAPLVAALRIEGSSTPLALVDGTFSASSAPAEVAMVAIILTRPRMVARKRGAAMVQLSV